MSKSTQLFYNGQPVSSGNPLPIRLTSAPASAINDTPWNVFYTNGSGVLTRLALGSSGTVLQSNGASSAPSFATPTAGGGVGLETVLMLGGM